MFPEEVGLKVFNNYGIILLSTKINSPVKLFFFVFSGINGLYYDSLGKRQLSKADYEPHYTCDDYLYALNHGGLKEEYIGRQTEYVGDSIDYDFDEIDEYNPGKEWIENKKD